MFIKKEEKLKMFIKNLKYKGGYFMKILEIVFGNSCYMTMKNSSLRSNDILLCNLLLNVGDLSKIEEYKIDLPDELCNEIGNYSFEKEILIIKKAITRKDKIRIWTSHYNVYSHLIMLYICNILKNIECDLYVTYSDEYDNTENYISPSVMDSKELEKLANLEHKLSKDDKFKFSNIWKELVNNNSEMRILENGIVKSVPINYYDNMILDKLQSLGSVKVSKLVAMLMQDIYLIDNLYAYFIKKLIKKGEIKVVKIDNNRFFDNIIELV